jgi:uncharacterized protein YndB with AHSA1/START domain
VKPQVLRIEKRINADPARLFKAWLDADQFPLWFLSGVPVESASIDPRPGGRFCINMIHKGKIQPHEGEYQTIDEPRKLVFTWRSHATGGRDTLVTVIFTALPDVPEEAANEKPATLITLIHEQLTSDAEVSGHRGGWTNILAGLERWIMQKQ